MGKGLGNQRGMASLLGVCALGILIFLSGTLYAVSMSRMTAVRDFLVRNSLRNTAEDGVRLAISRMNAERGMATKAEGAVSGKAFLFTGKTGDADFDVYARKKNGQILLLGVGKQGDERARAVGVLARKNGKYVVSHWER